MTMAMEGSAILPLLLLYTAFNIAWSVIAEAGASFLGFDDPDQLSWGGMLYELWISGKSRVAWWWLGSRARRRCLSYCQRHLGWPD